MRDLPPPYALRGHPVLYSRGRYYVVTRTGIVIGRRYKAPEPPRCCNGNCGQGRTCPRREPVTQETPGFWWMLLASGAAALVLSLYRGPQPWF